MPLCFVLLAIQKGGNGMSMTFNYFIIDACLITVLTSALLWNISHSSFYQNEDIFVQWDELDELNTIIHAWIGFSYSLTQVQKTFQWNGWQLSKQSGFNAWSSLQIFCNLFLFNSSNLMRIVKKLDGPLTCHLTARCLNVYWISLLKIIREKIPSRFLTESEGIPEIVLS